MSLAVMFRNNGVIDFGTERSRRSSYSKQRRTVVTKELEEKIVKAYLSGHQEKAISSRFDVGQRVLCNIKKRNDLYQQLYDKNLLPPKAIARLKQLGKLKCH